MNITTPIDNRPIYSGQVLTAVILFLWLALISVLGLNQVFIPVSGEPPVAILASFAITLSAFSVAYLTSPAFKAYILGLDMRFLIMLHSWRMLGLGFIMLHLFDHLPALFAYLAGLGDALTAIAAVFLVYALLKNEGGVSRQWIWRWNTFGLVDFLIAVSTGILTQTSAPLAPGNGVNSDLMTHFPFVVIPTFLVQVFTLTHLIIYLQLRNNHRHQAPLKVG